MKTLNGKAIRSPKGKAAEYAAYSCNFYVGCSNGCEYCYLKKGVLAHAMGGDKPTLKKCFKDESHALYVFEKELQANLPELQKYGLFFTFTSDPMLPETILMTEWAMAQCVQNNVNVKLLTKNAEVAKYARNNNERPSWFLNYKKNIAIGFTLTGHDNLEPYASPNAERIEAMRKLYNAGFKTWASIEPIISFPRSLEMIYETNEFCNLYKIGLESGKKYHKENLNRFISAVFDYTAGIDAKIYFKDSLLQQAGINREDLPANCVTRDYNIFENVER